VEHKAVRAPHRDPARMHVPARFDRVEERAIRDIEPRAPKRSRANDHPRKAPRSDLANNLLASDLAFAVGSRGGIVGIVFGPIPKPANEHRRSENRAPKARL